MSEGGREGGRGREGGSGEGGRAGGGRLFGSMTGKSFSKMQLDIFKV